MADKRDGDELFEDLDKFFAPIRDVDWEDDDQPGPQPPRKEAMNTCVPSCSSRWRR